MLARPPTSRPPMALGWPVTENGPAPGLPMRPVARWQLMMALTLSVPRRRLVHALAVDGDGFRGRGKQAVEAAELVLARGRWRRRCRQGRAPRRRRALGRSRSCVRVDIAAVERVVPAEIGEQAGEQRDVAIRRDRQMQVGDIGGHGAARIDQHDLHLRPLFPGRRDALVEHRMAPGEVGADQHDRGRQARDPRRCPAPCRSRRRGGGRQPTRPCRGANWCRCWPSR